MANKYNMQNVLQTELAAIQVVDCKVDCSREQVSFVINHCFFLVRARGGGWAAFKIVPPPSSSPVCFFASLFSVPAHLCSSAAARREREFADPKSKEVRGQRDKDLCQRARFFISVW